MSSPLTPAGQNDRAFATLRQFVRKRPTVECCEMCSTPLAGEHQHLIEQRNRVGQQQHQRNGTGS